MAIKNYLLKNTMSELRSIYYLDREWKTYLEDKEYIYSDVTVFRQEKKILFKYTDIEYSNMHDKSSKDPRWPIQKREEEIAKFCKQYGIRFDVETKIDYSEPFTEGSKTVRNARILKDGKFVIPKELSIKLLHKICEQNYDDLTGRLRSRNRRLSEEKMPEAFKKAADAAVSMICDDIALCGRSKPESGEYLVEIVVNAEDFRYTEPGGDMAGLIFKNEGVAPLKDRSEKEFFAALVMEGIHRELIEKGSSSVLDIYADSSAGHSADGCEAFMIVMYKQ